MRNFLLVFRNSLDGADLRLSVTAADPVTAEKIGRKKAPKGMRCVRVQARDERKLRMPY